MGKYIILGDPSTSNSPVPHYRGIYRSEAYVFPAVEQSPKMMDLCIKYIDVSGINTAWGMGVNLKDFSMDELIELSEFLSINVDSRYEIMYYDFENAPPVNSKFVGIDIAGVGGYSLLGEGLFTTSSDPESDKWHYLLTAVNESLLPKLNENFLFNTPEDAQFMLGILREWKYHFPDFLEDEGWRIYYMFKVNRS